PTWSLAIEEQFYLVWPAIVLLCSRRALMRVCAGLIVVAIACRAALSVKGITYPAGYVFTPCHTDGLAIGAAVAILARRSQGLLPLVRPAAIVGAYCAAVLILMAACTFLAETTLRDSAWAQPPLYALIAITCGTALLLSACAAPASRLGRIMDHPILRTLGKYSYALYLFN